MTEKGQVEEVKYVRKLTHLNTLQLELGSELIYISYILLLTNKEIYAFVKNYRNRDNKAT
jgi:hypothetical protein